MKSTKPAPTVSQKKSQITKRPTAPRDRHELNWNPSSTTMKPPAFASFDPVTTFKPIMAMEKQPSINHVLKEPFRTDLDFETVPMKEKSPTLKYLASVPKPSSQLASTSKRNQLRVITKSNLNDKIRKSTSSTQCDAFNSTTALNTVLPKSIQQVPSSSVPPVKKKAVGSSLDTLGLIPEKKDINTRPIMSKLRSNLTIAEHTRLSLNGIRPLTTTHKVSQLPAINNSQAVPLCRPRSRQMAKEHSGTLQVTVRSNSKAAVAARPLPGQTAPENSVVKDVKFKGAGVPGQNLRSTAKPKLERGGLSENILKPPLLLLKKIGNQKQVERLQNPQASRNHENVQLTPKFKNVSAEKARPVTVEALASPHTPTTSTAIAQKEHPGNSSTRTEKPKLKSLKSSRNNMDPTQNRHIGLKPLESSRLVGPSLVAKMSSPVVKVSKSVDDALAELLLQTLEATSSKPGFTNSNEDDSPVQAMPSSSRDSGGGVMEREMRMNISDTNTELNTKSIPESDDDDDDDVNRNGNPDQDRPSLWNSHIDDQVNSAKEGPGLFGDDFIQEYMQLESISEVSHVSQIIFRNKICREFKGADPNLNLEHLKSIKSPFLRLPSFADPKFFSKIKVPAAVFARGKEPNQDLLILQDLQHKMQDLCKAQRINVRRYERNPISSILSEIESSCGPESPSHSATASATHNKDFVSFLADNPNMMGSVTERKPKLNRKFYIKSLRKIFPLLAMDKDWCGPIMSDEEVEEDESAGLGKDGQRR